MAEQDMFLQVNLVTNLRLFSARSYSFIFHLHFDKLVPKLYPKSF
jgi:hypothetical protein